MSAAVGRLPRAYARSWLLHNLEGQGPQPPPEAPDPAAKS